MDDVRQQRLDQGAAWVDRLGLGDRVAMAAAYGSILGTSFDPVHSDLNLLLVLDPWDEATLAALAAPVQLAATVERISPMFITRQELIQWPLLFPTKLHALLRRHRVLRGEDLLAGLSLDPRRIRRDCQMELANIALKVRRAYLHGYPVPGPLLGALLRFLPKLRDVLRSLHQLKGGQPEDPLDIVVAGQSRALGFEEAQFHQAWALREHRAPDLATVEAAYRALEALIRQMSGKLAGE